MIGEIHAFGTKEDLDNWKVKKENSVSVTPEFANVTYDQPFKNVFSIKRILAVVIKETIELYQYCSVDEIVDLIESIAAGASSSKNADDKIILTESSVKGEGTVKFDIIVKVGVPMYLIEEVGCKYVQIRLNLEMQQDPTPGYPLTYRGLYYGSRLISDQIAKVNEDTNYGVLVPVYSIWITLVGKTTDAANSVLRYQLRNTGSSIKERENSFIGRMDKVTDLLNIYLICIDKSILETKEVEDGLDDAVEFISLLFAGKFNDNRMDSHDIKFQNVVKTYGEEIKSMAKYYSDVDRMVMAGEARGRAEGRAEGEVFGVIRAFLNLGYDKSEIISTVAKEFSLTSDAAANYLTEYYARR